MFHGLEWTIEDTNWDGDIGDGQGREELREALQPNVTELYSDAAMRILPEHISDLLGRGPKINTSKDNWKYTEDNDFAKAFFGQITRSGVRFLYPGSPRLCERCARIDLKDLSDISEWQMAEEECRLCKILSECIKRPVTNVANISEIRSLDSPSRLRICALPGTEGVHPGIRSGFPTLPDPGSPVFFKLVREWVRVCNDRHHNLGCSPEAVAELPTRVLDLGEDLNSSMLRLHISQPGEKGDFIALSHCWGNLPEEEKENFCTSKNNINIRHRQGFDIGILPQTFRDAVEVTRQLGIRYLWIDSLCIIQYGDDFQDWEKESLRMEAVFRHAYCTIAATSARDSTEGFLARPSREQDYVKVPASQRGPVYICSTVEDFNGDVENAILNQRGWVLQERAMSRRTIHFTTRQMYWECGGGVRCETHLHLSMHNPKTKFLADPEFPNMLRYRRGRDIVSLFQYLFTRYSQLGLTNPTDRSVAISGIERLLAQTFRSKVSHGVFETFLHRSILWKRSGAARMKRILYARHREVPSWSWMAYEGQIEYVNISTNPVAWYNPIRLADGVLEAHVRNFQGCRVERKDDGEYVIRSNIKYGQRGWLKYDCEEHTETETLRCIIVGRGWNKSGKEMEYYVLVVVPASPSECIKFRRVGVGVIPEEFILLKGGEDNARVI